MAKFRVQARVLELLGEEQIADLPTAISELFKNAYDAYANTAILDIHQEAGHAVLWDDGSGMSEYDINERWLVVGTPSKKLGVPAIPEGRQPRPVMGEKGIGRLAISRLGDSLLLVSKKPVDAWGVGAEQTLGKGPFSALFLNWNLARNPRLVLSDLDIPLLNFDTLDDLNTGIVDDLVAQFRAGVAALAVDDKWDTPDLEELRAKILRQCDEFRPDMTVLRSTALAKKASGSSFFIGHLHDDLGAYIGRGRHAKDTDEADELVLLLSNYSDRFSFRDDDLPEMERDGLDIDVRLFRSGVRKPISIFDEAEVFGPNDLETYDHRMLVHFDAFGTYSGVLERFGDSIDLAVDETRETRRRLACGPFSLTLWYWGGNPSNTRLSPEDFASYGRRLERFGGLMVYRSGLRVLPYGKPSFDWLRLEEWRSKWAGRYFFSHRRMFGFVSIGDSNPALRDKAGREGLINNQAYRDLKTTLREFFREIAARYFFRNEEFDRKAAEVTSARTQLEKARQRAQYRRKVLLKKATDAISSAKETPDRLQRELDDFRVRLDARPSSADLTEILSEFDRTARSLRKAMEIPSVRGLGLARQTELLDALATREEAVQAADDEISKARTQLAGWISEKWPLAEQRWRQKEWIAREVLAARTGVGRAYSKAHAGLTEATEELTEWVDGRKAVDLAKIAGFHEDFLERFAASTDAPLPTAEAADIVDRLSRTAATLGSDTQELGERLHEYIVGFYGAEAGQEAAVRADQAAALQEEELERLDEELRDTLLLAQAGLAAEIADHDLSSTYHGLRSSLNTLRAMLSQSKRATKQVETLRTLFGHLELQYRQIQPLYRARRQHKEWISGPQIFSFVHSLMKHTIGVNRIVVGSTAAFDGFRVLESTPMVLPVFINLVDNSTYWLRKVPEDRRKVQIDFVDGVVTVCDTGPGIRNGMHDSIFERFVSTKPRGRGLGLYIARTVLRSAGHEIWATNDEPYRTLPGACFCVRFTPRALEGGPE